MVGMSSVVSLRGDEKNTTNRSSIRRRFCGAMYMELRRNGWSCGVLHPNGWWCAGQDRSDSHAELDHSELTYAEHNRYALMYVEHSIEPERHSPNLPNPNQPTACTKYFEALIYSLKQNCERRGLSMSPVPCSIVLPASQRLCRRSKLNLKLQNTRVSESQNAETIANFNSTSST